MYTEGVIGHARTSQSTLFGRQVTPTVLPVLPMAGLSLQSGLAREVEPTTTPLWASVKNQWLGVHCLGGVWRTAGTSCVLVLLLPPGIFPVARGGVSFRLRSGGPESAALCRF